MSASVKTVKAVWCGPFDAHIPDGTTLERGDTYDVDPSQLLSGHWHQVEAAKAKKADS